MQAHVERLDSERPRGRLLFPTQAEELYGVAAAARREVLAVGRELHGAFRGGEYQKHPRFLRGVALDDENPLARGPLPNFNLAVAGESCQQVATRVKGKGLYLAFLPAQQFRECVPGGPRGRWLSFREET